MTEVKISGLDPRDPDREARLSFVPEMWRASGRLPDADDVRAVNERILDSWYDFYRLHSPDGWDEWNDPDDPVEGRPTEAEWDDAQGWFYGVVRDIDAYSPDGRDMEPAFARGLVWDSVKDGIPGYRDWEAVVEPAYDARLREARKLAPVERGAWLREHPVEEFIPDDEDVAESQLAVPDGSRPLDGRSAFAGMCLTGRVPERNVDLERVAFERAAEAGKGVRMADVALEVEEMRESAAVAAAEREADAVAALNREADADEYGLGQ